MLLSSLNESLLDVILGIVIESSIPFEIVYEGILFLEAMAIKRDRVTSMIIFTKISFLLQNIRSGHFPFRDHVLIER